MAEIPKNKATRLGGLSKIETNGPIKIPKVDKVEFPPSQPLLLPPPRKNLWSGAGQVVVRPDDFLTLRIEVTGLTLLPGIDGNPAQLKAENAGSLTLHFQPQAIAEQCFEAQTPQGFSPPVATTPLTAAPLEARIAGESRLVFNVPKGTQLPYTVEGILAACRQLTLQLADNALPPPSLIKVTPVNKLKLPASPALRSVTAQTVLRNTRASSLQIGALTVGKVGQRFPTQLSNKAPIPNNPGPSQSALELPWRLLVSPTPGAQWQHALQPVAGELPQRFELWHSLLDTQTVNTLRAIWARTGSRPEDGSLDILPQFPNATNGSFLSSAALTALNSKEQTPFLTALSEQDRVQLVHLSSNFSRRPDQVAKGGTVYVPLPFNARLLGLSALGGWLDLRGAWTPAAVGYSLSEWRHRSTQARDHAVRVVYEGVLFPFGHAAAFVKYTERVFITVPNAQPKRREARLRTRYFIVIRQPERLYHGRNLSDTDGVRLDYAWPFSRIRILNTVTPDVDPPAQNLAARVDNVATQDQFFPCIGGKRFNFDYEAEDYDGNRVRFSCPAIFLSSVLTAAKNNQGKPDWSSIEQALASAKKGWNAPAPGQKDGAYKIAFNRQVVALAESSMPGDTRTEIIQLDVDVTHSGEPPRQALLRGAVESHAEPAFYPQLKQAEVVLPVTAQLTGNSGSSLLRYAATYLKTGFSATKNKAGVFAELENATGLDFSKQGDRSGGFVMPNLVPTALTRLAGPVSGKVDDWFKGKFDPASALAGGGGLPLPVLFGCLPLDKLISAVTDVAGAPAGVPRFVSEATDTLQQLLSQLGRLHDLSAQLAELPAVLVNAGVQVLLATLDDLKKQALAQVQAHTVEAQKKLTALQSALLQLQAQLNSYASAARNYAQASPQLPPVSPPGMADVQAAVAQLPALLSALSDYVAQPPAPLPPLPAGYRQSMQLAAENGQRLVADVSSMLALAAKIPPLLDQLRSKLDKPGELQKLLDKPTDFVTWIVGLKPQIVPVRNAVADMRLLEGPLRSALLGFADFITDIADHADVLNSLLESLLGDEVVVRFDWHPALKSFPASAPIFRVNDPQCMTVAVEARVKKSGGDPSIKVSCALHHFDLILIGDAAFIELNFEKIEFTADPNAKPHVDVLLSDIKFVGPLSFVEALRDLIPLDGFSDPPYLDVTTKGIDAGFTTSLPNLPLGMLSLSNLSLGAGFTVPFIGEPLSVRFNFCTREQPFNLTVSMFGGGGFFGITLDPSGIQILEAAFEFGACVSMSLGVASGGVHVMAGIYFRMGPTTALLAGYFRVGGHVSVLAIASVSLELYLELSYETATGKAAGFAKLTIEISVFMFSIPVTIECERKFAGSNGDPSFRELMGPDPLLSVEDAWAAIDSSTLYPWREYCEAFAA